MEKRCIVQYLPDHPVYTRKSVNKFYCKLFGVTPEQVTGRSCLESTPEVEREKAIKKIRKCIRRRADLPSTEISLRPDGSRLLIRWVDVPITDDKGKVVEIYAVGTPLEER